MVDCVALEKLEMAEEHSERMAEQAGAFKCDICESFIYRGDTVHFMPDGDRVCDSADCVKEWAEYYRGKAL